MERFLFTKRRFFCAFVLSFAIFASDFRICATASVKSSRQYDPNVFVVTPDSISSKEMENDFYPVFLPTPVPQDKLHRILNETNITVHTKATARPSTSTQPDIIIAEFRAGSAKTKGKPNERMLSVKEMLDKEKTVTGYTTTQKSTTITTSTTASPNMKVEDVWHIINHSDDLARLDSKKNESYKVVNVNSKHSFGNVNAGYTIETVPSIEIQEDGWPDAIPKMTELLKQTEKETEEKDKEEAPRTILSSTGRWSNPQNYASQRRPQKLNYYPSYNSNEDFTSVDGTQYDPQPGKGEAIDRYNPSKPYLPPKQNSPPEIYYKPPPSPPMPPPPPPPPPPSLPPKQVISPPSMDSYDSSYQSYPPSQDSSDDSKPPSDSYSYQPPDMDSGPPSYPPPPSDHYNHHDHHSQHDGDLKFELPPSDGPPSSGVGSTGVDTYPSLIFDQDHHHDHHHDSAPEIDYSDFYHHHHHEHPPPPPPTTTTEAPAVEDKRVNNRYSYYYLGKKLWYLPLYFSIYFIIYVGVLIVKSIARHKITYPQHWKTRRSVGDEWGMSDETLQMLTKFVSNALIKSAAKYLENRS